MLTQRADDLQGQDGVDNTFLAPVTQNETGSGQLANTFETGDKLDGGADSRNILEADLVATGAIGIGGFDSAPISAETTNIQEVYLRAQSPNFDFTIDAEKMEGVEQWWSDNSRANIAIEDIRSNPADTAFGMRNTDPGVSFFSYFNANAVTAPVTETESALTLTIQDITDGAAPADNELARITVREINFSLEGEDYTLDSEDMRAANTWAELEAAIAAQLGENGLAGVTVEHRGNGVFVLEDANSGAFEVSAQEALIFGAESDIDVRNRVEEGLPQQIEGQTETAIFLDDAGNGSQGGMIDVGVMSGDRGVEVFNTTVLNDSHVTGMMSSNLRTGDQYLEEVYVDGQGDLTIGVPDGTFEFDFIPDSQTSGLTDLLAPQDGRVIDGLVDVRVVDASELDGELNAGITLTDDVIGRYLDGAEEPVNFEYTGTANDDILSFQVDDAVASDLDFRMSIDAGAGDDRINLMGDAFALNNVSIDGGEGNDTLETSSSIGTGGDRNPAAFSGIENLVLAGFDTNANMAPLGGVEQVVIATGGTDADDQTTNYSGGMSTVSNLEADTTLTISGKNQTLGNGSNNDQDFGTITLTNAQAENQLVSLDNTARNNGELTVGGLTVDGANSAVRELTLNSGGGRQTTNVVNAIDAAMVTSLLFTGSQALAASVDEIGEDADGDAVAFNISGADLEGSLNLTIDADNITDSNDEDEAVTLTGTANDDDVLTLTGTNQNITSDTTVNGFETVVFGNDPFSGTVDVNNFNDVELFHLNNLDGATTLNNLSSGANVEIGEQADGHAVTLNGTGTLNVEVSDDARNNGAISTEGFSTVNLDLGEGDHEHSFALNLDGDARNLVITGEDTDQATDGLDLTAALPATLAVVDVSGYAGSFTGSIADFTGTDTRFEVGAGDFDLTMAGRDFTSSLSFTMASSARLVAVVKLWLQSTVKQRLFPILLTLISKQPSATS